MSAGAGDSLQPASTGRSWPRVVALLVVTMLTSAVQPSVLIATPFLGLAAAFGMRGLRGWVLAILATIVVTSGSPRDGVWFMERAWAVVLTGGFVALTIRRPHAAFAERALGALGGAGAAVALFLALDPGSWATLDGAVSDRMARGVDTALEALRLLRDGEGVPQALVAGVYETVEAQVAVFPALLGIGSMAALGVAWWLHRRLGHGDRGGLGRLADFRFNDHLVWVLIGGLVLLVARWGDGVARVGANAFVFMSALYAARGAAVVLFISGGLSLVGYVLLVMGLLFLPPLVLAAALVIGLGDTWLDIRGSIKDLAA